MEFKLSKQFVTDMKAETLIGCHDHDVIVRGVL
jgi:hypothetical protein